MSQDQGPQHEFARAIVTATHLSFFYDKQGLRIELDISNSSTLYDVFEPTKKDVRTRDVSDISDDPRDFTRIVSFRLIGPNLDESEEYAINIVKRIIEVLRKQRATPWYGLLSKKSNPDSRYRIWSWQPIKTYAVNKLVERVEQILSQTAILAINSRAGGNKTCFELAMLNHDKQPLLKCCLLELAQAQEVNVAVVVTLAVVEILTSKQFVLKHYDGANGTWLFYEKE